MVKANTRNLERNAANSFPRPRSETLIAASHAADSAKEFTRFMGRVMRDVVSRDMTPTAAGAICNAAGKILKVAELQHRYGTKKTDFDILHFA